MSSISINSEHRNDPHCRYKMQAVSIKSVDQGQYAKTTIFNLKNISESLYQPEEIIFKFIGYDLGTSGDFKKMTLKGYYHPHEIQGSIDKYIQTFVLCSKCAIPEVDPELAGKKKRTTCTMHCAACGHINTLLGTNSTIDKPHKLINKDIQGGNEWRKHKMDLKKETDNTFDDFIF